MSPISIATLLKSHFGMGILLQVCCIFSEHLFLRAHLEGYFCLSAAPENIRKYTVLFDNLWKHQKTTERER